MEIKKEVTELYAKSILRSRDKFASKHDFGHALLIAGSSNKIGAAILASKGCHRAGVGLFTAHIPLNLKTSIITHTPETILSFDQDEDIITGIPHLMPYNVIGCGPGIGTATPTARALKYLLDSYSHPIVLDADAINILSDNRIWCDRIPTNSIITPHHREFERLVGSWKNEDERLDKQLMFAKHHNCIVVLKGANTSIVMPDGSHFINTTGNPGMAAAGSGDVLTGIILGLMAQGYSSNESAILGVYLHGKSGDIAADNLSQHSMIASDIIDYLPKAFLSLER